MYLINPDFFRKHIYFFMTLLIIGSLGNEFHKYTHYRKSELNSILSFLQENYILCDHEHHSEHHNNSKIKYCVILQFNNYILDNLNFWRQMENIVYYLTGIKPIHNENYMDFKNIHTEINYKTENNENPGILTMEEINYLKNELKKFYNNKE